jgi:arsenate reductase
MEGKPHKNLNLSKRKGKAMKKSILFICVHNSGRSQMAETFLQSFGGDSVHVESAGYEPTTVNPMVVQVMKEEGFDLTNKVTKSAFEMYKKGKIFNYVITVCDENLDHNCPVYPGMTHRLHIPFPDPEKLTGTDEEKIAELRLIRDAIKEKMKEFHEWIESGHKLKLGESWELQ